MSVYTWPPTLADFKAQLGESSTPDSTLDPRLQRYLDAAVPLVENITGPIASTAVTEWHSGGSGARYALVLRQRPVISVTSVIGYIGTTAVVFAQAADPSAATSYSYTLEQETGIITCRVGSGSMFPFPWGETNLKVVYNAGQATVPANAYEACLIIAANLWQMTQNGGRPSFGSTGAEDDIISPFDGYAIPAHARELLEPDRRIPGIA